MVGITYFVALPFDVAEGSVVVGEPIECPSPATAIVRAQGLWKVLGHTGAVAFSRTGDPATGDFHDAIVLRKFGDAGNGALPNGPSYRAHPRLYQPGHRPWRATM